MERITGKKIKVSAHSITIKGESGKTAGVIRDIRKFKDLRPSEQMDFKKAISPVWGKCGLLENVVFKDGKMYFLHDLRPVEFYEKMFASNPEGWESETRRYNERKAAAENMAKHCTVIPCYIEK